MTHALPVTRAENFAQWYQTVVAEADLAEESGVRGCMVIRPWGYGIWERMQRELDDRIRATGHDNCYFPLFIPLSYFAKEAEHVDGFAKEMAVVTHHRLSMQNGRLAPDPEAKLEEPLIVRPTSETVIGAAFARWIQSWRDLPVKVNQWANVVRWEMRTRMFLRTSEFLWQEGHTAHETADEARAHTLTMLEVYRSFVEETLALPVIAGEKPENERFPGADATFSIEAMMQDGKALQAGTSHFLGTSFAAAQDIGFQDRDGGRTLVNTTSWGVSTRLVGAVIMVHGDDDGLRCPPRIAPAQVVILPMLRNGPDDVAVLAAAEALAVRLGAELAFGERVRVRVDKRPLKAGPKKWGWVKQGAPLVVEIGPRDVAAGSIALLNRTALYGETGKLAPGFVPMDELVATVGERLEAIQRTLHKEARARLDANVRRDAVTLADLDAHFAEGAAQPGWLEVTWSRPTGAELEAVEDVLKARKLTLRNAPFGAGEPVGQCIFTGAPGVERILVARAY